VIGRPASNDLAEYMQVLVGRRLLACSACGWVHYAMTAQERAENDRALKRYSLTASERSVHEASLRQCLRCEAPVTEFRDAREPELGRAASHLVTPVLIENN
jgi:hypothetical protein